MWFCTVNNHLGALLSLITMLASTSLILFSESEVFENSSHAPILFFRRLLTPLIYAAPAVSLSALFFSSTISTEPITASKYPEGYKAYRERVDVLDVICTLEKRQRWDERAVRIGGFPDPPSLKPTCFPYQIPNSRPPITTNHQRYPFPDPHRP